MSDVSDREAFRALLIDRFALRTAEQVGDLRLPSDDELATFREIAAPRADEVLRKYEQALYADALTEQVLDGLRDELVARSRVSKLIEAALNVSALVIASLIGLSQFIFDPARNSREISAIYYVLLFLVSLQLIGNLYLKYFDRNR